MKKLIFLFSVMTLVSIVISAQSFAAVSFHCIAQKDDSRSDRTFYTLENHGDSVQIEGAEEFNVQLGNNQSLVLSHHAGSSTSGRSSVNLKVIKKWQYLRGIEFESVVSVDCTTIEAF